MKKLTSILIVCNIFLAISSIYIKYYPQTKPFLVGYDIQNAGIEPEYFAYQKRIVNTK